jgi:membrane protein implicated in regulation of membrane protease activity
MSHRIEIHSRSGNVALGVVGAIYFIAAVGTLMMYLVTSWGAAALIDHLLQLALAGSAIGGACFLLIAAGNLGFNLRRRRGSPNHQRAAATSS